VYKGLKFKQIPKAISEMVVGIVPALAIVSSVALFGWVLQFEHLGTIILEGILAISENRNVVLLLINIILLMMGCFLDSTAVILMFIPMFLPLVKIVGINEIHLGVIVVLNLMIGLMTPPVGQSLYMMASVTGKSFGHVVKNTWSWLIPLFISLIIITYSPNLVLWFPRLLGLIS
jgi:TRAP-type C4-dicarboxylate transport system permease large subunit